VVRAFLSFLCFFNTFFCSKELERAGVIRSMTAPEVKVQLDSKIARQVGWNPNDTTGKWKNQDTSKSIILFSFPTKA